MTGPGRPTTGTPVHVRIPPAVLARVDARAAEHELSRAEVIRRILTEWAGIP